MTRIAMLLFPNLTVLDLIGPLEVLARMPDAKIHLVAETLQPITADSGVQVIPNTLLADCANCEILFVPGGNGVNLAMDRDAILQFLAKQGEQAQYVTSVCTGALLLGAAGLLRGYRATTHWLSLDLLAILGAEPIDQRVVIDRNRVTGGGITAGIDFGLTLAALLHGQDVAERIQLMLEYQPQPPFNAGLPHTANPQVVSAVRENRAALQAERREKLALIASKWTT